MTRSTLSWLGMAAVASSALMFSQCAPPAPPAGEGQAQAGFTPLPVLSDKGGTEVTGPYDVDANWPQPITEGYTWGRTGGVWAESPDRIYVVQTGEIPVATRGAEGNPPRMHAVDHPDTRHTKQFIVFDGAGKLIESWEEQAKGRFVHPHSVKQSPYDADKNVWVTDGRSTSGETAHQVWKFTHEGQHVLSLGEYKVQGDDETHFGGPTDLAFLPNGDFYVADGYRNGRIVRFNKDGKFVSAFGTRGKEPGQLNTVHGVAVDGDGRVYAADRGNGRVQVFDETGKLLDLWPNIPFPMDIAITNDGFVWVADGQVNKFLKFNKQGQLLYSWGTFGTAPGRVWGTHRMSVDSQGNFYTADVWGGRAQKFVPKKGVDPARLVGMFYGFK